MGSFGAAGVDTRTSSGADEFVAGEADTIAGLETPDDHTLVVRLKRAATASGRDAAGSSRYRARCRPAPRTATTTDYEAFQVSSGPYMIEGADREDLAATDRLRSRTSLTLVRNPSWSADDDPLRPAYADRIEIAIAPRTTDFEKVARAPERQPSASRRASIDAILDRGSTFVDPAVVERYRNDPGAAPAHGHLDDDPVEYLAHAPDACRRSTTCTCGAP